MWSSPGGVFGERGSAQRPRSQLKNTRCSVGQLILVRSPQRARPDIAVWICHIDIVPPNHHRPPLLQHGVLISQQNHCGPHRHVVMKVVVQRENALEAEHGARHYTVRWSWHTRLAQPRRLVGWRLSKTRPFSVEL